MGGRSRTFLLDDHEVVREGVKGILNAFDDIEVVGEAGTAAEGLRSILQLVPDVAVVDVRLPDGSGIEVIRDVRSRQPAVHCVVFTSYADEEAFFQAVVAGAAGYLVKDAKASELAEAIRAVSAGQSLMRKEVINDLRRRAQPSTLEQAVLAGLTAQERRIMGMIVRGLTNREIGLELSISEKTVRNYVSSILSKVGMKNRTQLAAYVATVGRESIV